MNPKLTAGLIVLVAYTWGISALAINYCEGEHAKAVVQQHEDSTKIEYVVQSAVVEVDKAAQQREVQIQTVYKTIYVEVAKHENSNLDAQYLSAGWVRIFNEGASGMSDDTSSVSLDDAAASTVTAAAALRPIIDGQAQYHEVANRLIQCQSYVTALEPFYK